MIVAITGTPGVGKTSVCSHLRELEFQVIDINKLVSERFHKGFDNKRRCFVADLRKLRKHIKRIHKSAAKEKQDNRREHILLLDSHISHLLHPDVAIVLRANPLELAERLRRKGFEERKIKENMRAETLDVVLVEAVERCKFVYEIDTTGKSVEAVAECVREILSAEECVLREHTEERRKEMLAKYEVGGVDWSEYVEDVFAHCDDC